MYFLGQAILWDFRFEYEYEIEDEDENDFSILVYNNTYPSYPMSYSLCLKPARTTRALETSLI